METVLQATNRPSCWAIIPFLEKEIPGIQVAQRRKCGTYYIWVKNRDQLESVQKLVSEKFGWIKTKIILPAGQ